MWVVSPQTACCWLGMIFLTTAGAIELDCVELGPKSHWREGEAAALLLAVRALCRSSSACPFHKLLSLCVRSNSAWGDLETCCQVTGADKPLTSRLVSRVAQILGSAPIAAWRKAAQAAAPFSGTQHPAMLPELGLALTCLRAQFVRISDRANEMMPWSPPLGLALQLTARAWDLRTHQAVYAQALYDSWRMNGWAAPLTLPLPPSPPPHVPSAPLQASLAQHQQPAPPAAGGQPSQALPTAGAAPRARLRVGANPQPRSAFGAAPCVGCFYQTAQYGVVHVISISGLGVLCGFVAHDGLSDQSSDSEGEDAPQSRPTRVERITLSRHGCVCWSTPLAPEDAPSELRDDAALSALRHASSVSAARCASLARDLRPGGRLTRQPPSHGMDRNPLLMGQPPIGFGLILLRRERLEHGYMSIIGDNLGPRRELSARVRNALQMWRLEGCVGGCATFPNLRLRVRTHLERVNGRALPGKELTMRLSAEEAAALLTYGVTSTLVRSKGRHLIVFPGSSAPQYLGVEGAAALMGVTSASAGETRDWLLRLSKGGVRLPGAPKPMAPATGTLRAVEMIGSAIQLDVATRLFRHADAMVVASESRLTLAEQFAGLALATSAATRVWPMARPLFFSDSCPLARNCLESCWPGVPVCNAAEGWESHRCFPWRVFALIAGFPCNVHSGLAHGIAFSGKLSALDVLFSALTPLRWEEGAPTIVLLENTPGILAGAFLHLCARLLVEFGEAYHWFAGVACPSLHASVPTRRLRVYLLAVHKQRATDSASWPVLEGSAKLEALLPIPTYRGLVSPPGDQGAASAPGDSDGRGS